MDGSLASMPPALIQTGSREMVYVDAELMSERLSQAGVPCELQVWERQVHVFQAAAGLLPEAPAPSARSAGSSARPHP